MNVRLLPISVIAAVALALPASAHAVLAAPAQQSLRVAIGARIPVTALDPMRTANSDVVTVQNAFLAPLYYVGPRGVQPQLAAGAPVMSNRGKRYTVRLRTNARWSDGSPVVAKNVVQAFNRSRKVNYFGGFASHVKKVSMPNARTIVFDLSVADATFPTLLALPIFTPVPSHVIARAKTAWTKPGSLVSSGPFVLKAASSKQLSTVRNPRFWGAKAVKLQRLAFVTTGGSTVNFAADKLDATAPYAARAESLRTLEGSGIKLTAAPSADTQYAYLNTTNVRLRSSKVRRGIALALNRNALLPDPSLSALSTFLSPSMTGGSYATSGPTLLKTDGSADIAAATAELAAGGWNNANVLNLYHVTGSAPALTVAEGIKTQLAAVGVTVVLNAVPGSQLSKVGYGVSPIRADVDIVLQGWIPDYADPANVYALMSCHEVKNGFNVSNYCNQQYDTAYYRLFTNFGFTKRLADFRILEQRLTGPTGSFPVVPLYTQRYLTAAQPWVRGYSVDPYGMVRWDRVVIDKH
ncbi:MAG: peptide transporter substrate-binding protein [Thermoleophilia bacterium]|nr:peptide transporter substrate-binding protein [Thermoleophilia bacterium]